MNALHTPVRAHWRRHCVKSEWNAVPNAGTVSQLSSHRKRVNTDCELGGAISALGPMFNGAYDSNVAAHGLQNEPMLPTLRPTPRLIRCEKKKWRAINSYNNVAESIAPNALRILDPVIPTLLGLVGTLPPTRHRGRSQAQVSTCQLSRGMPPLRTRSSHLERNGCGEREGQRTGPSYDGVALVLTQYATENEALRKCIIISIWLHGGTPSSGVAEQLPWVLVAEPRKDMGPVSTGTTIGRGYRMPSKTNLIDTKLYEATGRRETDGDYRENLANRGTRNAGCKEIKKEFGTNAEATTGLESPEWVCVARHSHHFLSPSPSIVHLWAGRRATSSNATMQGSITPERDGIDTSLSYFSMSQLLLTLAQHLGVDSFMPRYGWIHGMLTSRKVIISNRKATTTPGNTRPRSRYEERPGRNISKAAFTFSIAASSSSSCGASSSAGIIRWGARG
ncbi:hypothetical protein EDB85DRAFT_2277181 [Lactarius pseudohatsudake]|nr:hypothetical protein EDB85DRAFT_2277181 [Lactarius pseudohatsudake]